MSRILPLLAIVCVVGCAESIERVAEPPAAATTVAAPLKVTPVAFTEAGDPIVEFSTPGMHCEACAASITKALVENSKVVEVDTDPEAKVVAVTFSREGFDPDASTAAGEAVAAIADAGFGEATPIEAAEPIEEAASP